MKRTGVFITILLASIANISAQTLLKEGFDKHEYLEVLKVNSKTAGNTSYNASIPFPTLYDSSAKISSPIVGFDNKWEIWLHKDVKQAVISFRGSTAKLESWISNAYAASMPATGEIQLDKNHVYKYQLALNSEAYVHTGWLASYGYLQYSLLPCVDSLIKNGYKDFIISGHSQGGAIAYLCSADIRIKQSKNIIPNEVNFKTLCGAAPKPGNLYFAYDYEKLHKKGWAYNVVNSADWVPEMPLTVQTVDDINPLSPFAIAKPMIKKLPFAKRLVMNYAYNSIDKPLKKSRKKINNILGDKVHQFASKSQPDLKTKTSSSNSINYSRAGEYILLYPNEQYHQTINDTTNVFLHHMAQSYIYLLEHDLFY